MQAEAKTGKKEMVNMVLLSYKTTPCILLLLWLPIRTYSVLVLIIITCLRDANSILLKKLV